MRALLSLVLALGLFRPAPPAQESAVDLAFRSLAPSTLALDEAVRFADLREEPGPHLGQERLLLLQFDALVEDWEPYMTRFGPERHVALRAWADEQFPWVEEEYKAAAVFVFLRKDSTALGVARQALRHQRFAARVVVRELFAGKAWIEVQELVRLPEEIGEGTLLHAIEALRFERVEAWELAIGQFERALAAPLPPHARAELEAHRQACLERLRPPASAQG